MLALHNDTKIYSYPQPSGQVVLPNGNTVLVAVAGWVSEDGLYKISELVEPTLPAHDPNKEKLQAINKILDGVPTKVWIVTDISPADIDAQRALNLKAVCRTKIFERYSDSDQKNGEREAIRLIRKEAKGEATPEDIERLAEMDAADDWINNMVDFCREKVADGKTTVADLEYVEEGAEPDPETGKYPVTSLWPAHPGAEQ